MTRYWAVRTSWQGHDVLAQELLDGRLRQGWGYEPGQDLRLLKRAAETGQLRDHQDVWRRTWKMLVGEPGAMAVGDRVVAPWLPDWEGWSICEVTGAYDFEILEEAEDYGHVVPVIVRQRSVNPHHDLVSAPFRASMRCALRMWNLDRFGADIEALLESDEPSAALPEIDRLHGVRDAMADATYRALVDRYRAAEFERPMQRLMEAIFGDQVEHTAGRGEHGADLICRYKDALGTDHAAAVQIKMWQGSAWDDLARAIAQIREAYDWYDGITSGVIVTLLDDVSNATEQEVVALSEELHIPVRVLLKEDVIGLFLQHLPSLVGTDEREPDPGEG